MAQPGLITSQLISHLLDAELVIADLSLLNPNAFYEMGIRHAVQKPIIHMFLAGTEIPFDVKPYRAIEFSYSTPAQLKAARSNLREAVDAQESPGFTVENPVTAARGKIQIEKHATPEIKLLLNRIEQLETRVNRLPVEKQRDYDQSLHSETVRIICTLDNARPPDFDKAMNAASEIITKHAGTQLLVFGRNNTENSFTISGNFGNHMREIINDLISTAEIMGARGIQ